MTIEKIAQRWAKRTEAGIEWLLARDAGPPVLEAYRGYTTADALVLRGRVLSGMRRRKPLPEQSRWTNLKQMVALFLTAEVSDVAVEVTDLGIGAKSDAEGYVTIEVPRDGDLTPGWIKLSVDIVDLDKTPVPFPVLVPSPDARFGVISDVDDTMIETGAYSLARNMWTTFTGSALTRHVFPDSVAMMDELSDNGTNPVFYVSSSPWNLHHFLDTLFARHNLVPGPMFLRDLGVSEKKIIAGSHLDHKGAAIDKIIEANPGLNFILCGDTGQHDAEVYLEAIHRHPGRILAIVLRQPGPGPDDKSRKAMAKIEETGVPLHSAVTFDGIGAALLEKLDGRPGAVPRSQL